MLLLSWRCSYVEDVVTLMALIRWRCCYVENVETAFKTALWMWRVKNIMCISPMVLWWIITCFTFLCYSQKNKTSINTKFHRFLRRHHKMTNLANIKTKKLSNGGQHIPGMLSACWTDSICCEVMERSQKIVKYNEHVIFQNCKQRTWIALRRTSSLLPGFNIYRYMVFICIYMHTYYIYIYICVCVRDVLKKEYWGILRTILDHHVPVQGGWWPIGGKTGTDHAAASCDIIEGSLEVKLPTIWTVEKQRWEESEEKRSEERRCRCAKR